MVKDKKLLTILLITFSVLILDQITKWIVKSFIFSVYQVEIIKGFLYISMIKNTGAAFGILQQQRLFLILVPIVILLLFVYYYKDIPKDTLAWVSAGLILGGALGNLTDRLILGYVIDFVHFTFWPAFNVADSAISIGAVLYAYLLVRKD